MNAGPDGRSRLADVRADGARYVVYGELGRVRVGKTRAGDPYAELVLSDATASLTCKVWRDSPDALRALHELAAGAWVKAQLEGRRYEGQLQPVVQRLRAYDPAQDPAIDPTEITGPGAALVADLSYRALVFDIETIPATEPRKMPPTIASALAKHVERTDGDEAKSLALSPWFGRVVSVAIGDAREEPIAPIVLVVPPPSRASDRFPGWIRPMSEPELLGAFWALAGRAELVVSFNGAGFDIPFMIGRSLVCGVPVRTDLTTPPWADRPHLDLYRALSQQGRSGPANLDVICWALGIASPKGEMDGAMVAPAYARGEIERIAEYNAGDVVATAALFRRFERDVLAHRASGRP